MLRTGFETGDELEGGAKDLLLPPAQEIFSASIMGGAESVCVRDMCAQNNKVRGDGRERDR